MQRSKAGPRPPSPHHPPSGLGSLLGALAVCPLALRFLALLLLAAQARLLLPLPLDARLQPARQRSRHVKSRGDT